MNLKIGSRYSIAVRDLAEASRAYQAARAASGEGCSAFPSGYITLASVVFTVSYNGRVWLNDHLVLEAAQ